MWRLVTMGMLVVAALVLVACGGTVTGIVPVEGEGVVLVGPVGSTPTEPVEGVILCDTVRVAGSVCWQVRDSVRP